MSAAELEERESQVEEDVELIDADFEDPRHDVVSQLVNAYEDGETEEEFNNMVDFVDKMEFDRLGVFPYSAEEGTKAAEMDGQIPEDIKESRRDEIMALQQEISAEKEERRIGQEMSVLIEGYLYEDDIYIGRTYMDAPKVDGNVFVRAEEELISGDIVPVRITGANEYDLMGDVIYADEFTE